MAREGSQDRLTVLVTGAGAPPGVSIVKALRQSALRPRIVVTDADALSVGMFRADAAFVLPRVKTSGAEYLRALADVCVRERVALVCFGSEVELRHAAAHAERFERETGARLAVNAPHLLDTLMDKWGMVCALRDKALPVPDTVLASDGPAVRTFLSRHPFPIVLKPRRGSGSKNLFVLRGTAELDFFSRWVDDPVLQEYLLPDDEEYTVGVYKSRRTGYVGQIVFRRTLAAGLTYKAMVVHDEEIEAVCRSVVEAFDVWGPVNVQLRKTPAGVRVFEINLRFSSSAPMRARFGFNEADICLRDAVLGEALSPPPITDGYALRYWDEVYVSASDVARLRVEGRDSGPRGTKADDF